MAKQALLLRTLVDLADNLVDDFDVVDTLTCSLTAAWKLSTWPQRE